jgi:hypothetical protein
MIYHARAVTPDDIALTVNPRVAKQIIVLVNIIAVIILVNNGGLLLLKIVGNKAKIKPQDPIVNTQSCHICHLLLKTLHYKQNKLSLLD